MAAILRKQWVHLIIGCMASVFGTHAFASTQYTAQAKVISAEPILHREVDTQPVKRCHWENLPDQVRHYPERYERRVTERRAKRCRYVSTEQTREITKGYRVTLNYHGETFVKFSRTHPGRTMPVTIFVRPAEP